MSKMVNRIVGAALTVAAVNVGLSMPALCTKKKGFKIAYGSLAAAELALGLLLLTVKPKAKIPFFTGHEDEFFTDEEIETIKASISEHRDDAEK